MTRYVPADSNSHQPVQLEQTNGNQPPLLSRCSLNLKVNMSTSISHFQIDYDSLIISSISPLWKIDFAMLQTSIRRVNVRVSFTTNLGQ